MNTLPQPTVYGPNWPPGYQIYNNAEKIISTITDVTVGAVNMFLSPIAEMGTLAEGSLADASLSWGQLGLSAYSFSQNQGSLSDLLFNAASSSIGLVDPAFGAIINAGQTLWNAVSDFFGAGN